MRRVQLRQLKDAKQQSYENSMHKRAAEGQRKLEELTIPKSVSPQIDPAQETETSINYMSDYRKHRRLHPLGSRANEGQKNS